MQFKQVNVKSECIPRQAIKAYGRGGGGGGGLTPIINFPNIYIYIYIYGDELYSALSYIHVERVVGTATGYGLHDSGFKSRWRLDFSHPSRRFPRLTLPPLQRMTHFPRAK